MSLIVEGCVLVFRPQPFSELQEEEKNFTKYKTLSRGVEVPRTHLVRLRGLELLELMLETQVGAGAGSDHLDGGQRLLPAHSRHRHDVSYHQGDAAGNTCQAAKGRGRQMQDDKLNTAQNLSSALCATVSSITCKKVKRCHFSSTALSSAGV